MSLRIRKKMFGGTSLLFIYAVIVAAIFVLIIKVFVSEKTTLWDIITKRYKSAKGDEWKDELKKDVRQMETEFSSTVSQDFKRAGE